MIGFDKTVFITKIRDYYYYEDDNSYIYLTIDGLNLDATKSELPSDLYESSGAHLLQEGYECRTFAYCVTDCPNISSPYDNVSLSYNLVRVIVHNATIVKTNPLTLYFTKDDMVLSQLAKPQH